MMSESYQSGHPDADQLNAFMENVLSPPEREQTLAHLAACANCRMVVALASGVEEDAVATVVVDEPRRWRLPAWLWGLPVAAVLGLVFVTVHRETPRMVGNPPVEQAAVKAPAPPIASDRPLPQVAPQPQPVTPREKAIIRRDMADLPEAGRDIIQFKEPAPKIPAVVAAAPAPQMQGVLGSGTAIVAAAPPVIPAPPPVPAPKPATAAAQPMMSARSAVVGAANAPKTSAVVSEDSNASATVLTGKSLDALSDDPDNRPTLKLRAMAAAHPLPSGLPAVSVTSAAGATLTLDSGNNLFVTRDAGMNWETVEANWSGKAVRVGLVGAIASAPMAAHGFAGLHQDSNAPATGLGSTAEGSSSVTGLVTDPTGARIPGATVSLHGNGGALMRTVTTDQQGRYTILSLPPGGFALSVTKPGFSPQEIALTIPAGTKFNQDLKLSLGSESTVIEVQASNSDLQTSNASVGQMLPLPKQQAAPKKMKAEAVTAVFELMTDKGERWVSADGVTWAKK